MPSMPKTSVATRLERSFGNFSQSIAGYRHSVQQWTGCYRFTVEQKCSAVFSVNVSVYYHWYNVWAIVILHELGTGFRRGIAPVFGSGNFVYAYGTPANVNQVGLLYLLS